MKIDLYCQRYIDYVDILLGVPPLGVKNRNTVSENGDFLGLLALCVNISETVRDTSNVTIVTINEE